AGELSRGPVVGITGDARGRVLVAFRDAGLFQVQGDHLTPISTLTRPAGPLGILVRGSGRLVWLGVRGGVVRGDGSRWTFLPIPWTRGNVVTSLVQDQEGALWVGCEGSEILRLDVRGDRPQPLAPPVSVGHAVFHLATDPQETLWISSENGLFRLRKGATTPERLTPRPLGMVDTARAGSDGGLWIGTHSEGLFRLHADEFTPYGVAEGLPNDVVWNVLETADGWLYASTNGGLTRLRDGKIERVTSPLFPTSDAVALAEGRDGSFWVGTFRHGVFRRAPGDGAWEAFGAETGIPPGPITVVFEDRLGRLWIGSREGLAVGRGRRFERVALPPGASQPYVAAIVEDARGTIYVATYGAGLFAFRDGAVHHNGPVPGLPSSQLNALHFDGSQRLWIATNDRGLLVIDHGRVGHVHTGLGLPFDVVLWMVEDRRGGLWLSTNHGVVLVSLDELARAAFGQLPRITPRVFDEGDGLRGTELSATGQPAGWRSRDGRLWFPGTGLMAVDPEQLREPVPPPALIHRLTFDGTVQPLPAPGTVLALPPGRGEIELKVDALGFDEPAGTRFRHRLIGFDEDWREVGPARSVRYTNLPPRAYRFEVSAQHQDGGPFGPAAAVDLRLAPRFTQTWTFYLLLTAGATGLVIGGVRLRNRRLRALVARRTVELRLANDELTATAQRELQARERAEAALAEAERASQAKTDFLATVSHELRTPLHAILGMNELLLQTLQDPDQLEWSGLVKEGGQTLLGLVEDLLDFARIGHGEIDVHAEPFDLVTCLTSCVDFAAPMARDKDIALGFTFQPAGERPWVLGDKRRLRQVATNLVANAVKFTEKGSVEVTAALVDHDGIATLHLEVRDTGVGIAPELHEKIFQPFVQADSGLSRRYGGTGLGLAITARLCAALGGTITVESAPGKGSTFQVCLPLPRVAPGDAAGSAQ
ncbi:MAG TPA: hypothetical protein DD490_08360, partial [Acidobacteria bacterium]|nr:hypothetical protein [Acidobacteriota bacterium]